MCDIVLKIDEYRHREFYPVHNLVRDIPGETGFADCDIEQAKLLSILEAARYTYAACYTQPWSFIIAQRDQPEEFACLRDSLSDCARERLAEAPALILGMLQFDRHRRTQAHHDFGRVIQAMTIQARALGLITMQTTAFDSNHLRHCLNIPRMHQPQIMLGIGYAADLPAAVERPRQKPLGAFVFSGKWGQAFDG